MNTSSEHLPKRAKTAALRQVQVCFHSANDEGTLFCKCVSKNGKHYTRAFDDVGKHCHPIVGKENEYKGYVTMYYEYEGRDIQVEYSVWYKEAI